MELPPHADSWLESDWATVAAAFDAVCELPEGERAAAIGALPEGPVRTGVRALFDSASALDTRLSAPPVGGLQTGDRVGDFVVRRKVGEGGMGAVYAVEDPRNGLRAAVKVLTSRSPEAVRRFVAEQQLFGRLDHPSIPKLLGTGTTADGRPYLVTEFVDGLPITEFARSRSLGTVQRLELFALLCDAVRHVHRRGVVHRDVKPANVLASEGPDGRPRVHLLDFGIAKVLSAPALGTEWGRAVTREGPGPSTPAYAAPEQGWGGPAGPVTTTTDVHALGRLLYELLTGRRLSDALADGDAALIAPSRSTVLGVGRTTAWALDTLVERAVDPDSERRYASASDLLDDVRLVLAGRAPTGAPLPWTASVVGFLSRRRAGLATGAVAVAAVVAAFAVADHQWRATAEASAEAEARVVRVMSGVLRSESALGPDDHAFLVGAGESIHEGLRDLPEAEADLSLAVADRLAARGSCDEAAPLYGRAALLRTTTATDHPVVVAGLRGQARCLAGPPGGGSAAQARRAAEYAEEALALAARRYGPASVVSSMIGTDLALYHAMAGDLNAAEAQLSRVDGALRALETGLRRTGRPPVSARARDVDLAFPRAQGREGLWLARARAGVVTAWVMAARGAYGPAAEQARRAVGPLDGASGPESERQSAEQADVLAFGLTTEGEALLRSGRPQEALSVADRAVGVLVVQYGERDPRAVRARLTRAAWDARLGPDEPGRRAPELAALVRDAEAAGVPGLVSPALQLWGADLAVRGREGEGRAVLERAVAAGRGGSPRALALALATLADLDLRAGNVVGALDRSERALLAAWSLPDPEGISRDVLREAARARAAALARAGRGGEAERLLRPLARYDAG